MKNQGTKIIGWRKLLSSFNSGILLSIVFIILPCGLYGNSLALKAMDEAVFQVTLLQVSFLAFLVDVLLVGVNNAIINVVICTLVLILALGGTYVRKLLKDRKRMKYENETKEISIVGLKEIIRLLEKKKNG